MRYWPTDIELTDTIHIFMYFILWCKLEELLVLYKHLSYLPNEWRRGKDCFIFI